MTNSPDMELKIIEAAIACIEKHGLRDTTVRRIALEANVNVAAINYYFRSKEQLMERVMAITLQNAFDWSHFADSERLPPKPRLTAMLEHLTDGAQAYPEITRAHLFSPIMGDGTNPMAAHKFTEFVEKIYDDMVSRGVASGAKLRFAIMQAVSASIIGIGLALDLYGDFPKQDLRDPLARRQYIEQLVDSVL